MAATTRVRCNTCAAWMPAEAVGCEQCGTLRPEPNRHLHVAALNSNLFRQAEMAEHEERAYQQSLHEERKLAERFGVEMETRSRPVTAEEQKQIDRGG